jgi:hypothetical protein
MSDRLSHETSPIPGITLGALLIGIHGKKMRFARPEEYRPVGYAA